MISLPIFTKNMNFFAWTFLNSSKIGRWKVFKNVGMQRGGKSKKTWRGCFSQTKWVPKKLFWWMLWYLLFEHLWKTPPSRRKLHSKSEKNILEISHLFFGCCRVAKYPIYKFTFTFHVFYFFLLRDKNEHDWQPFISSPTNIYLKYLVAYKMKGKVGNS